MRIDILVGGKFHADHMAEGLVKGGHDTRVFTSLPKNRFSKHPPYPVRDFRTAEISFRLAKLLGAGDWGDHFKMKWLAKSARNWIKQHSSWGDLLFGWSSFSLELMEAKFHNHYVLVRDSTHIAYQTELLSEEYKKRGLDFPRRQFCIDRELEEYELADKILVCSEFAKRSFIGRGFPASRLAVLTLGVDLSSFHPRQNLAPTGPLKAVYFGGLTLRKGIPYLLEAIRGFKKEEVQFTLVGAMTPELKRTLKGNEQVEWIPAMPQSRLAHFIREKDLFLFPTLEDGFGFTLPQAMASGLFPITTQHCGAADIIEHKRDGLVVPPADPRALKDAIQYALDHRKDLVSLKQAAIQKGRQYDWSRYEETLNKWVTTQFNQPQKKINIG